MPVALKDNIAVAGVPMTAGTRHLPEADRAPEQDAPAYEGLRRAGAVLLGKLHMSEWAIGGTNQNIHFGDVHNPWDPARVSGGSSGGSGAAISADLALRRSAPTPAAPIRLPASLNGCCGLRPTSGRVSNRGSIPVAWTFDTIGPLARRAEDVAAMLDAISGYDPEDPVTDRRAGRRLPRRRSPAAWTAAHRRAARLVEDDADFDPAFAALLDEAVGQFERLGRGSSRTSSCPAATEALELTAELLLCEAAWFHQRPPARHAGGLRAGRAAAAAPGRGDDRRRSYGRGRQGSGAGGGAC